MKQFEEDLEYANKILRIRSAMIDGSIVEKDGIRSFSLRPDVFEYHMELGSSEVVIGYLENRDEYSRSNYVSWDAIYYDQRSQYFSGTAFSDHPGSSYYICDENMDEAWYFQKSLIMDPTVLRAAVVFNILRTVKSKYQYFQLRTRNIETIIERL